MIYIGCHQTRDLDDDYLGSGTKIKQAIRESGRSAFQREIIGVFDNADEMFDHERDLVDDEFVGRSDTYNSIPGGRIVNPPQKRPNKSNKPTVVVTEVVSTPMPARHFSAWVLMMKSKCGWSKRKCAAKLGCGINQIAVWESKGAPPYIALACSALSYGLPEWREA